MIHTVNSKSKDSVRVLSITIDNLTKLIKTYSFRVGFDSVIHSFLNPGDLDQVD